MYRLLLTFACFILLSPAVLRAEELPQLKVAVLKIGTVNWELDTIKRLELDKANGFELVVQGYAGGDATRIAFQGGEADVVVADWIWTARQRAAGKGYATFPYSTAVGGLVVSADSKVQTLADLKGEKIGIAGGPLDKSWLILRAYAQQKYGIDLVASTEQVYGAPPLIFKSGLSGEIDGAINFWHFLAKMKSAGMRQIISVSDAADALGLDPATPLLGYVIKDVFVAENPNLVMGFYAASRAAKAILAEDDAAWNDLRARMNASSDAQFFTLRDDWRVGIPPEGPVDEVAANAMLAVMATLGGTKLVGDATTLPAGTFLTLE
ncbi:ABC transporter substrate-binding protein [Sulfitobacter sp. EhC04]|uniref:ABC transporter substrate-binding protein n=1 Tax=Sulfitobacter sp. EhC04 TaxID=1849168 RepID=UPI0007F3BA47|nr:ABC transporter substrate-binding protein [Sulfitobacter sp. EhC04]OAN75161.1 ABC transporter substrate-binding protein [Sulfitobacter sp. EhC04]